MNLFGVPDSQGMEVLAFLSVDGEEKGLELFRRFYRGLTYLALFHYPVDAKGEISGTIDKTIVDQAHSFGVKVLLVLSNFVGKQFNPFIMRNIFLHRDIQDNLLQNLTTMLQQNQLDGVNLDLENMFAEDRALFSAFISRLAGALRAAGKVVTLSVPAKLQDDPQAHWRGAFDYRTLGQAVDRVVLMTYEEHWAASTPGPVASTPWVNGVLNYATSQIIPAKLYLGLPMYGYDWPMDNGTGKTVTHSRALHLASRYNARIVWDDVMQAPHFTYTDEQGTVHRVWFEHVASAQAKIALARQYGLRGLAVWEMKLTFPEFWQYIINNVPVAKV